MATLLSVWLKCFKLRDQIARFFTTTEEMDWIDLQGPIMLSIWNRVLSLTDQACCGFFFFSTSLLKTWAGRDARDYLNPQRGTIVMFRGGHCAHKAPSARSVQRAISKDSNKQLLHLHPSDWDFIWIGPIRMQCSHGVPLSVPKRWEDRWYKSKRKLESPRVPEATDSDGNLKSEAQYQKAQYIPPSEHKHSCLNTRKSTRCFKTIYCCTATRFCNIWQAYNINHKTPLQLNSDRLWRRDLVY